MKVVTHYLILKSSYLAELEGYIRERLATDWELQGGLVVFEGLITQVVVKYGKKPKYD